MAIANLLKKTTDIDRLVTVLLECRATRQRLDTEVAQGHNRDKEINENGSRFRAAILEGCHSLEALEARAEALSDRRADDEGEAGVIREAAQILRTAIATRRNEAWQDARRQRENDAAKMEASTEYRKAQLDAFRGRCSRLTAAEGELFAAWWKARQRALPVAPLVAPVTADADLLIRWFGDLKARGIAKDVDAPSWMREIVR